MRWVMFALGIFGAAFAPYVSARGLDFNSVVAKAKALAQKPYQPPKPIPGFLQHLSFNQYQAIRFNPQRSLWRSAHSRFQIMLISPGLYYTNAVKINVIDETGVHPVPYRKNDFSFPNQDVEKRVPADLGYAGFKLTYPLDGPKIQNQFLVFAGASYFRGVAKGDVFGLSVRGIAVDTGLPTGEEFPSFTEYWLVRPAPDARAMKFYALLNGKRVTGAYRFVVYPGNVTVLDVTARLFARDSIPLLGIAPLTSMFFYGENTPRPPAEWRPQVHDSDGLLIHNGESGEWLWRPLINPQRLEMYYFGTDNVRGFGLLQRQRRFSDYQDLGARYDKRPDAWVEPEGNWGKGHVVLVELPTALETNDNIVAFWTPDGKVTKGAQLGFSYTLRLGGGNVTGEPMGYAADTFVGSGDIIGGGNVKGAYRLIVDFAGGPLSKLPPRAPVTGAVTAGDGGKVIEDFVEYVKPLHRWRLSILAQPAAGKPLSLRAFLKNGKDTLTETWTYHLPADNAINPGSK